MGADAATRSRPVKWCKALSLTLIARPFFADLVDEPRQQENDEQDG